MSISYKAWSMEQRAESREHGAWSREHRKRSVQAFIGYCKLLEREATGSLLNSTPFSMPYYTLRPIPYALC